mmetsp:Transcript_29906/g.61485  ORF Transcript_29906/g.61485 Transcript_29906/m.61485 type:complete len:152 (+) Transcript_29906:46-501(+)
MNPSDTTNVLSQSIESRGHTTRSHTRNNMRALLSRRGFETEHAAKRVSVIAESFAFTTRKPLPKAQDGKLLLANIEAAARKPRAAYSDAECGTATLKFGDTGNPNKSFERSCSSDLGSFHRSCSSHLDSLVEGWDLQDGRTDLAEVFLCSS